MTHFLNFGDADFPEYASSLAIRAEVIRCLQFASNEPRCCHRALPHHRQDRRRRYEIDSEGGSYPQMRNPLASHFPWGSPGGAVDTPSSADEYYYQH